MVGGCFRCHDCSQTIACVPLEIKIHTRAWLQITHYKKLVTAVYYLRNQIKILLHTCTNARDRLVRLRIYERNYYA